MDLSAILLSLAALGGVAMAVMRLRGAPQPPDWFPPVHGLIAALGVAALLYAGVTGSLPQRAKLSLLLLLMAAAGGFYINRRYHQRGQPLPLPLVLGHGLTALLGLALLISAAATDLVD